MDRAWIDEVVELMGKRYRVRYGTERAEIEYRAGKVDFHPSRFFVGGDDGRTLEVGLDFRLPKGTDRAESEPFVGIAESKSMTPRGFTRVGDEVTAMTNQNGEQSGCVRSVRYEARVDKAADAARHIRAIVESVEIPFVVGIHEERDLVAKDPRTERPKPQRAYDDKLEELRFRLANRISYDLSVFVDQNTRTLRVVERKLLSTAQLGETIKLAHIGTLGTRVEGDRQVLVAVERDGDEIKLAEGAADAAFTETAERLAKRVRIPFARL